ncbi:MAG: hypothetical protein VW258_03755, partial [Thalassolituus sp.]
TNKKNGYNAYILARRNMHGKLTQYFDEEQPKVIAKTKVYKKRDAFLHDPRHAKALHERALQVKLNHSVVTKGLEGGDLTQKRHANAMAFVKSKLL